MYNILVTGRNGQLGSEIRALSENYPNDNFFFTDVEDLDICNYKEVAHFIKSNNINAIINCAAYTAVDKAEDEFEIADKINHLAVANFAKIAKENHIKYIHVSTDYVFDGTAHKPYTETDIANPKSVYGKTKLDGEKAVLKINPANSIIIRTSWVYSSYGNNFVKTMIRLGKERNELSVVADQIGTPTYASDLATVILTILPQLYNSSVELFHYSNEGVCSWYDFAKAIFELSNLAVLVNPIESVEYPTPAQRPFYSVLNKSSIKERFDLTIPYWKDSLTMCIQEINLLK